MGKLNEQLQSSIRRQDGDRDVNDRSSARVGPLPPPRPGDACRRGNVRRVRGIVRHVRRALPELQGKKGGACGRHRQARARTRSTREWAALFQRTWKTTKLQRQETCGQHWKYAGCCVRASAGGIVRALPVHNDGGVSRYRA